MKYLILLINILIISCSKNPSIIMEHDPKSPKERPIFLQQVSKDRVGITSGKTFKSYNEIFSNLDKIHRRKINDKISETPINTEVYLLKSKGKLIGFAREIRTTTGCNSECLPINYTAFYYPDGAYLTLTSRDGLTKISHAPFTKDDLIKLGYLLELAPEEFRGIGHPTELTDALSGATLKKYENLVVKGAAYTTLRIHLYHQETLEFIKNFKL
jgi:hypothetical protein